MRHAPSRSRAGRWPRGRRRARGHGRGPGKLDSEHSDPARRAAGDLRADITAEDIAASLLGIFTVAQPPEHQERANRLLNILMDGLQPPR
jgi:hypothetical protein